MNKSSKIGYKGKIVARPWRRVDGRWQARTLVDQAFFGPHWADTLSGWRAAAKWLRDTGHELVEGISRKDLGNDRGEYSLAPMQGFSSVIRRRIAEYVHENEVVPFATEFSARLGPNGPAIYYTDLHRGGVRACDIFPNQYHRGD